MHKRNRETQRDDGWCDDNNVFRQRTEEKIMEILGLCVSISIDANDKCGYGSLSRIIFPAHVCCDSDLFI